MLGQLGVDPLAERPGVPHRQLARQFQGVVQHLAGQPDPGSFDREARDHPPDQPRDPDHEELVEVGGEDGQEPDPLQQRDGGVLGQLEHPLVEPEPALLAVQVPLIGKPDPLGPWDALDPLGPLGPVCGLSDGASPSPSYGPSNGETLIWLTPMTSIVPAQCSPETRQVATTFIPNGPLWQPTVSARAFRGVALRAA